MEIWEMFWTVALLGSAVAFAGITAIVAVKGSRDMKNMLSGLQARQGDDKTH